MIVTASDEDYPHIKTLFCCQDVAYRWVKGKRPEKVKTLYDGGASVSMVTHKAAKEMGLSPIICPSQIVTTLQGKRKSVGVYYEVPLIDRDGE
jgi:hypothetical protein